VTDRCNLRRWREVAYGDVEIRLPLLNFNAKHAYIQVVHTDLAFHLQHHTSFPRFLFGPRNSLCLFRLISKAFFSDSGRHENVA
jgi:hypothetical protein